MPTANGDGAPSVSVFAKYITDPEIERPPPLEKLVKQSRRRAELKTFLIDVLMNGPAPATLIEEHGAAHGFTEKQLRYAREQMNIVAFKETGRPHGRWFWVLPHDNRSIPAQQTTPSATCL